MDSYQVFFGGCLFYFIIFEIAHIIAVTNKSSHLNLKQNNKRRYWYDTQN